MQAHPARLCTDEIGHHRSEHLHILVEHCNIRNAKALAPHLNLLDNLIYTPDEEVRHLQYLLHCDFTPTSFVSVLFGCLPLIFSNHHHGNEEVQLQPIEPLSCHLTKPLHLLCQGCLEAFVHV